MVTLNLANVGDRFQIKGYNLSQSDIKHLQEIGLSVDSIVVINGILLSNVPGLIVAINGITVALNNNYVHHIYGEVLTKQKQYIKTR